MLKFIKNTLNPVNGHLKLTEHFVFEGYLREEIFSKFSVLYLSIKGGECFYYLRKNIFF
mgnify:CR=1 FL=1